MLCIEDAEARGSERLPCDNVNGTEGRTQPTQTFLTAAAADVQFVRAVSCDLRRLAADAQLPRPHAGPKPDLTFSPRFTLGGGGEQRAKARAHVVQAIKMPTWEHRQLWVEAQYGRPGGGGRGWLLKTRANVGASTLRSRAGIRGKDIEESSRTGSEGGGCWDVACRHGHRVPACLWIHGRSSVQLSKGQSGREEAGATHLPQSARSHVIRTLSLNATSREHFTSEVGGTPVYGENRRPSNARCQLARALDVW
ncbi:unnamed protein product [Schistocephalus solidus]|uniref:Uncharacterized protein n=1 Tax=Schistocephalus solidus TaxID=70667 RepID=A0A183SWN2_SCHSO|nr:unnamed protein product [Schistocephalus solidus]